MKREQKSRLIGAILLFKWSSIARIEPTTPRTPATPSSPSAAATSAPAEPASLWQSTTPSSRRLGSRPIGQWRRSRRDWRRWSEKKADLCGVLILCNCGLIRLKAGGSGDSRPHQYFQLQNLFLLYYLLMQCRNYMEQYSRTKSIREINKNRNSYKLLTQHSKLLSSNPQLKLSAEKKLLSQYQSNQSQAKATLVKDPMRDSSKQIKKQKQPLHTSTQINKESHSQYKDMRDRGKLRTSVADISSKSISSLEKAVKRIPKCGGDSKKNSLKKVTSTSNSNSVSIHVVSKSRSKAASALETHHSSTKGANLEEIYCRAKRALQSHQEKEAEWEREREGYRNRIAELEKQLQIAREGKVGVAQCYSEHSRWGK